VLTIGEKLLLGAFLLRSQYSNPVIALGEASKIVKVVEGETCSAFKPCDRPNEAWPGNGDEAAPPMWRPGTIEESRPGDACEECGWPFSCHADYSS